MKKYYIYIIGIVAALFSACENVSEEERILEVAEIEVCRTVLLEDYTGQACVNCPNAHKEAASLHECKPYHDNLIVVAMHAGTQAIAAPNGLKQVEGDEYADKFGIKNYPIGMINRCGGLKGYSSWGAAVYEEIQKKSPLDISVNAIVLDGMLNVQTNLAVIESVIGNLQLWILEDSIVAPQYSESGLQARYTHNHVFRDAVNGTWGEELELMNDTLIKHTNFELNSTWKPENLSVVAFVYNNDGVLQAAQCKVEVRE